MRGKENTRGKWREVKAGMRGGEKGGMVRKRLEGKEYPKGSAQRGIVYGD